MYAQLRTPNLLFLLVPPACGCSGPVDGSPSTLRAPRDPSAHAASPAIRTGKLSNSTDGSPARSPLAPLSHTFPDVTVAPGAERLDLCQSWTLANDEELWVSRVIETNSGGWHHSNWVALPEGSVTAEDGTWNCVDGGFDPMVAALFGTPFFNAATQSGRDVLEFAKGGAFRIPPHSMIVGQIHLLNTTEHPLDATLSFDVYPVRAEEVTTPLRGLDMNIWKLAIPPLRTSEFAIDCDFPESDFSIYYVMPHYHLLGRELTLQVRGGPHDGESIFDGAGYGEGAGRTLDPPFAVSGADGLRMACKYENTTNNTVSWGFGAGEMCTVFGFIDGARRFNADDVSDPTQKPDDENGVLEFSSGCRVTAFQ